ncbi:MAG: metallophosphoesterase [Ignavibacteria bacterium]|nr:metallophosphoesterase [Ignavibacteria bacterium]
MYKIAHISDLHLGLDDSKGRGELLLKLLEDIIERECSHIAVTGDIAENPVREDLAYAREIFAHFSLASPGKLSVVPGNHDIYGGAPPGIDSFRFPLICKNTDIKKTESQFLDVFSDAFEDVPAFPFVKVLGKTALIGINSMIGWSPDENPEGSNGGISKDKLNELEDILESDDLKDKTKIVLIHHHFSKPEDVADYPAHAAWIDAISYKMKFHNPRKFLKALRKGGVEIVLHGHTHHNSVYVREGITFVNSSACMIPISDDSTRKYNIISIPEEEDEEESITIRTVTI